MAVGIVLSTTMELLGKLDQADKAMEKLADKSRETSTRIINEFNNIGTMGIDPLLSKIEALSRALSFLTTGKIEVNLSGLNNVSQEAVVGAANVMKLVESVSRLTEVTKILAQNDGKSSIVNPMQDQGIENLKNEYQKVVEKVEELRNKIRELSAEQLKLTKSGSDTTGLASQISNAKKEMDLLIGRAGALKDTINNVFNNNAAVNNMITSLGKTTPAMDNLNRYFRELEQKSETMKNLEKSAQSWMDSIIEGAKKQSQAVLANLETDKKAQEESRKAAVLSYAERQDMYDRMFAHIEQRERKLAQIQAQTEYNKNTTATGALAFSANVQSYNDEKKAIEYLTVARDNLSRSTKDYQTVVESLNNAIRQHEESLKRSKMTDDEVAESNRRNSEKRAKAAEAERKALEKKHKEEQKQAFSNNPTLALWYSKVTASVNEQRQAIKYLQMARDNMDKKALGEDRYLSLIQQINKEIIRQRNELKILTKDKETDAKATGRTLDTMSQLQRSIALVFSVSQIKGYISQMVRVRAEFELQQKSLQVLLKSKDEADRLWQQTVDLAVRSPFRVGELISYTKQLAAYRIETDKLHDTTRRLADVSAGLGVDMQRLILAYGQVRAANYLRGTELRQFTEAGIPMLDELAKRFTELEGRMVSAGDVFERISKRMVSFRDVEAVFKSMTDAGGTFYRMQEEQSETLKGMISNLYDSIDLMLNDIGKSQDGLLRGSVSAMKSVVENWEMWSIVIKEAAIALAGVSLIKFVNGLKAVDVAAQQTMLSLGGMNAAGVKLRATLSQLMAAIATNPWPALAAAVAAVGYAMYEAYKRANKLNEDLEKIANEGMSDVIRSSADFKRLAETATDVTKSYTDQKEALDELKRKYKDIVPDHILEIENLKNMKGKYDDATQAIYEYIAAKTKQKKIEAIETDYGAKIAEAEKKLTDSLKADIGKLLGTKLSDADVTPIVDNFKKQIDRGLVSADNYIEVLSEITKAHTGVDLSAATELDRLSALYSKEIRFVNMSNNAANIYIKTLDGMKQRIDDLNNSKVEFGSILLSDLTAIEKEYMGRIDELANKIKELQLAPDDKEILAQLNSVFEKAGQEAPKWSEIINDPFRLKDATLKMNLIMYDNMIKDMERKPVKVGVELAKENFIENIQKKMDSLSGDRIEQEVNRVVLSLADQYKVTTNGLENLFKDSTESMTQYAEKVKALLESMKSDIKTYDQDTAQGTKFSPFDPERIENMKSQLPLVEAFVKMLSSFLDKTNKNNKTGDTKDWFVELANNIASANKEFMSLNKTFDKFTSKDLTMDKYQGVLRESIKALNSKGISVNLGDIDFTTEEGTISALKMLKDKLPKEAAKSRVAIEKALSGITGEVKINLKKKEDEKLKREIQDIFDKYSLYLDLKKINVPADLAKEMFGIDVTDLEGLKKSIEALKPQFQGSEMEKAYEDYIKKINDMDASAQLERTKTYVKYLLKSQSEAVKIKSDEIRQISEIQSQFDGKRAQAMVAGVRQESNQKLQKQQWENFKNSDMYTMMFDDIENMGTQAIDMLYNTLSKLKTSLSDLPVESVKEIMTQIKKLEEIKLQRNPFESLRVSMKEVNDLIAQGKTEASLQKQMSLSSELARSAQEQVDAIDLIANTRDKDLLKQEMGVEWTEKYSKYLSMSKDELDDNREIQSSIVNTQKKMASEAANGLDSYTKQRKALSGINDKWNEIQSAFSSAADSLMGAMEALGVDSDSTAMAFAQMGVDLVDVVMQSVSLAIQLEIIRVNALAAGTAMNSMLGVIGWVAMALQGVTKLFSTIFSIGDKKKQRQIEKIQDQIKDLEKEYKKLSEAIDEAYNINSLQKDAKEANKVLEEQIVSYQKMIALEEDKKKTDKDKIEEWKDEIESLQEEIADNNEKIVSTVTNGILDNVLDASRSYTEAWLESFNEVGDGLTGLKDNFMENARDMVQQQASMLITSKYVERWKNQLDQYINPDDLELTTEEAKKWVNSVTSSLPQLNTSLENYFKAMEAAGIKLKDTSEESELSGLQRGIQGITEDQADIIAAYLNSVRFFVSEQNDILKGIALSLGAGTETNNPMLDQLIVIATQITSLNGLFQGMTAPWSGGGRGLKVVL